MTVIDVVVVVTVVVVTVVVVTVVAVVVVSVVAVVVTSVSDAFKLYTSGAMIAAASIAQMATPIANRIAIYFFDNDVFPCLIH